MGTTSPQPGAGQQEPSDSVGNFNPLQFLILQALSNISTIKIVKVLSVDTTNHLVNVQIAVNLTNGDNIASQHGQIFNIPYVWAMGGTNAFKIDPAVGDLGVMVCCDRDISAVKSSQAIANPGSERIMSPSDGIYLFGVPGLNGQAPTQWFEWLANGGFNVTDSLSNVISSSNAGISINGLVINKQGQLVGNVTATGEFLATDFVANSGPSQVTMRSHIHPANGSPPTPGH